MNEHTFNDGTSDTSQLIPSMADNTQLRALFETSLQKYADRTAVVTDTEHLTYRELNRRAKAFARALIERDIEIGDRVAILLSNRTEFVIADIGIVKAGAARVPINHQLTRGDIETVLRDAGAGVVVTGPEFIETIDELADEIPALEHVISVADERELPEEFSSFESLTVSDDELQTPKTEPGDIAGQFYTGGTTGKPKGAIHTQAGLGLNLLNHLATFDISGDDTLLISTPLSHSGGMFLWSGLLCGATVVVHDGFDEEDILDATETHGVTWTFMVPTMLYRLLDNYDVDAYNTESLETIVYGAAPMTSDRLREGIEAFGSVFIQFYGQTEVPNLITTLGKAEHQSCIDNNEYERLRSAGTPTLLSDIKVVDIETRKEVPTGEEGEILARAPYVMDRYAGRPDATEETLQDDWLRTGDVGRVDDEGYLYLLDRLNDVIISGGMNVYSTEVEETLAEHPDIKEVAVIGVPHETWGEQVIAIVAPHNDSLPVETIHSFATEKLSGYKRPKEIEFVEEIPKTTYGKPDKKTLREPYWEDQDREIT